ncbi:hypothetical protein C8A05DRAFT_12075 [Staphylotrichum tortipilum]|uniref:Uncharacterized protein n=1 Tax=Staphylotrichum tortipilum TaxID=2831512 RepID=A0AAN6MSL5_9PEZI|nr:hypothetical protein C8A05DRAFT_12075 [Staphylotrichum longicolle]
MDEEKSPRWGDTQPTVSPSPADRILDRKIEKRGLTQGFSSNLARKAMPATRKVSDRSVRDMVTLFEESATVSKNKSSDSPRQAAGGATLRESGRDREEVNRGTNDSGNRDNSSDKAAATLEELHPEKSQLSGPETTRPAMFPSPQGGYQVEDYSLTLLKHKCYFNNRPLGRCLDDDQQEQSNQTRIQRVGSKKETENKNREAGSKKDTIPLANTQPSAPVQQLDSLMSELLIWQGASESSKPGLDQWWESRDRDEPEGFWKNVRDQLWVDEEEIYEAKIRQAARKGSVAVSDTGSERLEMKPSISASTLHASFCSDLELGTELEPELEPELSLPPMPTRPPPPVPPPSSPMPASPASQPVKPDSTAPSQAPTSDHPQEDAPWDDPPTLSYRISTDDADISDLPSRASPEPILPIVPTNPATNHIRYPSSPWTRPPTWRSPSSLRSSSPPPALPPQLLASTPPNPAPRPRSNHARARHRTHSSSAQPPSLSTAHSLADRSSGHRTPATSTSSVATWGRSSGTAATTDRSRCTTEDAVAVVVPPPVRRRLTTEEKLWEIDAFLSSAEGGEGREGWI